MLKKLGGLVGLAFGEDEKAMLARMTVGDVIDEHMRWKRSLQACIGGKIPEGYDPVTVRRTEHSVVGRWLAAYKTDVLLHYAAYFTVRAKHEQCHLLAGELMETLLAGDEVRAGELMSMRLNRASHELVQALLELNEQLAAKA